MEKYYEQDGYIRVGPPGLMFDDDGNLVVGDPWPAPHVRCVLDAHGNVCRRGEVHRCALCGLWWDVHEMSRAGGQRRPNGRGSYCLICQRNYRAWYDQMRQNFQGLHHRVDRSMAAFRKWYLAGALDVYPPLQQYPEDIERAERELRELEGSD
jgi:hypothetical protein